MSAPKFVDELPPEAPRNKRGRGPNPLFGALRSRPGQWAEIGRYPVAQRQSAQQRANYVKKRYTDIEATCRTVDGEVVLFARAVKQ